MNPATEERRTWISRAVFALDRHLRRQQGIYEYSTSAECLFRVQESRADAVVHLGDGTRILAGTPTLRLHLWNEHIPRMSTRAGASIGWARRASRAVDTSLRQLARCLRVRDDWRDVLAICADLRLASAEENGGLMRIATHYGFETFAVPEARRGNVVHRLGEHLHAAMLVLAANPAALRAEVFRREQVLIYMSRGVLESRYGEDRRSPRA